MSKIVLKIEGMMCNSCVEKVKDGLSAVKGVKSVDVNMNKGTATVEHEGASEEDLMMAVLNAGFKAKVKHGLFK